MTDGFTAGAVLELVDRVTPALRTLFQEFDRFDARVAASQGEIDKLGFGAVVAKSKTEMAELGKVAGAGATDVIGQFSRLGPETAPLFAEITKGAKTAFADLGGIADQASAAVVGSMGHMRQGVNDQFDVVKANATGMFDGMAEAARVASASAVESVGTVAASVEVALGKIQALSAEVAAKSAVAATTGDVLGAVPGATRRPGSEAGFGRARNHGGSGIHLQGGVPLGVEGFHARSSSGAGMAGLGAVGLLGLGVFEAAKAYDVTAKAGITGQLDMGGDFQNGPQATAMRELMQKTASMSGYSLKDSGEAILGVERMMGGLDFNTRLQTMNTLLPIASAEARLKETSLEESFKALVGLAHQTGEYDPDKLKDLAKQFSFASLVTDASLPQLERTLSYSLPVLHAGLDMDPRSVMMLTVMAQNAGITSTKSGTWLRSFFQQAEPGEGTTLSVKKHNAALRDLGMLDDENRVTWRKTGADGKIDWTASVLNVSKILGEHIRALPIDERLQKLHTAFGERGGSFASLMGIEKFVEQMPIIAEKMKNYKGGENALDDYSKNSPVQQARETWPISRTF